MMVNRIHRIVWLGFLGILVFSLELARPSQKAAAAPLVTSHPECTEPPPLNLTLGQQIAIVGQSQLGGFIQIPAGIPASNSSTSLVITCVSLDRTHYLAGMGWRAKVVVQNLGTTDSGEISVFGSLCRFMQNGITFTCMSPGVYSLGMLSGPSLGPGESRLIESEQFGFSTLPADPSPSYTSLIPGVPDNGTVYLRAHVSGSDGYFVTQAIYPSGPENPDYDPAQDADGDGWSVADGDCNDTNASQHDGANEIANNGWDEDCSAGDIQCPGLGADMVYGYSCDIPPGTNNPVFDDLDDDGYMVGEGDCNDTNGIIHPLAPELPDGLDNNCNGVIDEGFVKRDWRITSFTMWRDVGPIAHSNSGIEAYLANTSQPGIRYEVEIDLMGPATPEEIEAVRQQIILRDLSSGIYAIGASGFIPYQDFGLPIDTVCGLFGVVAMIPAGVSPDDLDYSNNAMVFNLESAGLFDTDLRFSAAPEVGYEEDTLPRLEVIRYPEAVGNCPGLLVSNTGVPDFPGYHSHLSIYLEGQALAEDARSTSDSSSWPIDRPDRGDILCVEIELDPYHVLNETDELNNYYYQIYEFRNPLFGPRHFELLDAYSDGPATCASGEIEGVSSTSSALAGGVGGVLGFIGFGVLGAMGAGMMSRLFKASRTLGNLLIGGGLIAGGMIGWVAGSRIGPQVTRNFPTGDRTSLEQPLRTGMPSCDAFLDPASAKPGDGSSFGPGNILVAELAPALGQSESAPVRYLIAVNRPDGGQASSYLYSIGDSLSLDLVALNLSQGKTIPSGGYEWFVAFGERATGGDLMPYARICQGSARHTFQISGTGETSAISTPTPIATATLASVTLPVQPPTETFTPMPTATFPAPDTVTVPVQPPTETFTPKPPPPPPDTDGPGIKNVSAAPDPIYVTKPKGCAPNVSTISAVVSDPSGVASVVLIYKGISAGSVSMSNAGGNQWQAQIGPFDTAGMVNYQIQAVDTLGNQSNTGSSSLTVLACVP